MVNAKGGAKMTERTEKNVTREIWLEYFNRYLLNHGLISKDEFIRMKLHINASRPSGRK